MAASRETIVAEHGELAQLISEVRRSHSQGASWDDLARMLDHLLETVRAHFESEESQMERTAYPMLDEHRKNHDTFLRRLRILRTECDRRETELMSVFMDLLDNWFKNHERTADGLLLEHMAKGR